MGFQAPNERQKGLEGIFGFCYVSDNEMDRKGKKDMVDCVETTIGLRLKMRWSEAKDKVVWG